jgi:thiamine biosynthesis lipoprotein
MLFRFNKLLLLLLFSLIFTACSTSVKEVEIPMLKLRGKTMGTTYSVLYRDSLERDFSGAIDSLLKAYNQEVSTYIKDSKISELNQAKAELSLSKELSKHLFRNFKLAKQVHQQTEGWFNPAVMPLVNYWGFGYSEKKAVEQVDSALIDTLVSLVNFNDFQLQESEGNYIFSKAKAKQQLDFSAIAKGDGVDEIGRFLEQQGLRDYMVEIGGEVRARGFQQDSLGWLVGINTPKAEASTTAMQAKVALDNMSLATSGNYRNFHEVNGVKYAHTINPHTGYPEQNRLLSVSVFAKDCALADALATGCMAMGLDKAWKTIENIEGVEAYFIYSDEAGALQVKMTPKVEDYLR